MWDGEGRSFGGEGDQVREKRECDRPVVVRQHKFVEMAGIEKQCMG